MTNNHVKIELAFRRKSAINKSDIVLSLGTGIEKKNLFPRAPNFRNFIQDGFFSRLKRSFIFLLTGQNFWKELWSRLDDQIKKDYFRLNIFFLEKSALYEWRESYEWVSWMCSLSVERRDWVSKNHVRIFVSTLFFELDCISTFSNEKYYCQNAIRCRIDETIVCEILTRLHSATLTFMTKNEILNYFEFHQNLCRSYHRYKKNVQFLIRHFTKYTTLYMKNSFRKKRKINEFFQNMLWFMIQQNLNSLFEWSNVDIRFNCDKCDFLQFFRLKKKVTPHHDFFGRKRIKLHWGRRFIDDIDFYFSRVFMLKVEIFVPFIQSRTH